MAIPITKGSITVRNDRDGVEKEACIFNPGTQRRFNISYSAKNA